MLVTNPTTPKPFESNACSNGDANLGGHWVRLSSVNELFRHKD